MRCIAGGGPAWSAAACVAANPGRTCVACLAERFGQTSPAPSDPLCRLTPPPAVATTKHAEDEAVQHARLVALSQEAAGTLGAVIKAALELVAGALEAAAADIVPAGPLPMATVTSPTVTTQVAAHVAAHTASPVASPVASPRASPMATQMGTHLVAQVAAPLAAPAPVYQKAAPLATPMSTQAAAPGTPPMSTHVGTHMGAPVGPRVVAQVASPAGV